MNALRTLFSILVLLLPISATYSADATQAPPVMWEFKTDADFLGWSPAGYTEIAVSGGSIKGITTNFPFLHSPELAVDAQQYPTMTVTAKSNCSWNGSVYFKHAGEGLADSRSVPFPIIGDGKFHTYVVDFSTNAEWKGVIDQVRIDPVYVKNVRIEISKIAFLRTSLKAVIDKQNLIRNGHFADSSSDKLPEWLVSPNSPGVIKAKSVPGRDDVLVMQSTAPGAHTTLRQNVGFDTAGFYLLSFTSMPVSLKKGDHLLVSLKYLDILGNPLKGNQVWDLQNSNSNNWSTFKRGFRIPERAASGTLEISIHSLVGKSAVCLDDVRLIVDSARNSSAVVLNTSKAFSWSAEWIWLPNSKEDDVAPVCFRRTFMLADARKVSNARVIVTADNEYTLTVNGHRLPLGRYYNVWREPDIFDITPYLISGKNVLAVTAINHNGPSGMMLEAGIHLSNSQVIYLKTDPSWKCLRDASGEWTMPGYDESKWQTAISIAKPPTGTWTDQVPYTYLGPTSDVIVSGISCPSNLQPGAKLPFRFEAASKARFAPGTKLCVDLAKDGSLPGAAVLRKEVSGLLKSSVDGEFILPVTTIPGKYSLRISVTNANPVIAASKRASVKQGFVVIPITVEQKPRVVKSPICSLKMINGMPMVVINGRSRTTMNYWIDDTNAAGQIKNVSDAGIHIYWLNILSTQWQPSGKFSFAKMDEVVTSVLLQDPEACIVPIVPLDNICNQGLNAWLDSHPDQMVRDSTGSVDLPAYSGAPSHASSMASKPWLAMAESLVRQLIKHVNTSRYADRVIGYLPSNGVTYEWQQWASVASPAVFVDYSEPARGAFIEWLQAKYPDIRALNSAWKSTLSSFNDIQIPTKDERLVTDVMTFLDPQKSRREVDYRQYYSEQLADDIIHITKVVKDETRGTKFVGVFYGYVTHVLGPYRYQLIGHSAVHKVLQSPDIDFLMSPSDYGDRQIGGGSGLMGPVGSVKLNGKVWIDQADLRSHNSTWVGRFNNLTDSKAGMIRNYANALINNASEQLYDFSVGWTSGDKRLMQLAAKLREIDNLVAKTNRKSEDKTNSLAVIVDEKSTYYTGMASNIHQDMVVSQYRELSRTGMGFDMYLLDDIAKLPEHKCYLFLNTFRITKEQQVVIENKLKRSGKTIIFVYAPGITDETAITPDRVADITGINLEILNKELPLRIRINSSTDKVLKYLPYGSSYGSIESYGPVLLPKEGIPLGEFEEMPGRSGLVVKRYANWTSVFSVAPVLPANLLRGIAESAGVTIANPVDGDITYGSGNLLAVHSAEGGLRRFHFKLKQGLVTELVSGKSYPLQNGSISYRMNPRTTVIFQAK